MPRKRGDHNQPYETKKEIIRFLLNAPSGRSEEPAIRDYLRDTFDISEQKNIKIHLKELQKAGCIEKKEAAGLANIWLVNDIKQIKKIAEKYESLISDLQKNSRVLTLLRRELPFFKEVGYEVPGGWWDESIRDLRTYVMWMAEHSQTFFKNCLLHEFYFRDFFEIWKGINSDLDEFKSITYDSPTTEVIEDVLHNIFLHTVITDKLNGVLDPAALSFIRENPMPLRWETFLSHKTQEPINKPYPQICIDEDHDKFEYSMVEIEEEFKEKEKEYDMELMSNPYL